MRLFPRTPAAILAYVLFFVSGFLIARGIRALRGPTNSAGISTVTINPSSTSIVRGSDRSISVTVNVIGFTTMPVPLNYKLELVDDDGIFWPDDVIDQFTVQSNVNPGIRPMPIQVVTPDGSSTMTLNLFRYQVTRVFELVCDDGDVAAKQADGTLESTGESEAEIFARFTILLGDPPPVQESHRITIKCVDANDANAADVENGRRY